MVYEAVEKALSEVQPTREKIEILEREMECAWGLIANAGTSLGHWETMPQEWQDCAARWRDRYFGKTNVAGELPPPSAPNPSPAAHGG